VEQLPKEFKVGRKKNAGKMLRGGTKKPPKQKKKKTTRAPLARQSRMAQRVGAGKKNKEGIGKRGGDRIVK